MHFSSFRFCAGWVKRPARPGPQRQCHEPRSRAVVSTPHGLLRLWRPLAALGLWASSCGHRESRAMPLAHPASPPPVASAIEPTVVDETVEARSGSEQRDRECDATINVPIDKVRAVLTDYDHYATILPKFGRSRIVSRSPQG